MKRSLGVLLLLTAAAWAADFQSAKLLEARDASQVGANTVADSSEGITHDATFVSAVLSRCQISVALEGQSYTAIYPVNKHLRMADLIVGELIPARIEGNRLVIKTLDGKEMKAKIVRREPLEVLPAQKPAEASKKTHDSQKP